MEVAGSQSDEHHAYPFSVEADSAHDETLEDHYRDLEAETEAEEAEIAFCRELEDEEEEAEEN